MLTGSSAYQILDQSALQWPNHPAVVDQLGSYSYAEISQSAQELATSLKSAGVTPGSIVGIQITFARDFLATLFGVLKVGAIAVPVAPNLSLGEQRRVLTETHVSWLISVQTERFPHSGASGSVALYPKLGKKSSILTLEYLNPSTKFAILKHFPDAAVIRHTSGTTAKSKGVVLSNRAVSERALTARGLLSLNANDTVLMPLCLSYHFVASALACLLAGATILDCSQLIAPEILAFGTKHSATVIYASPLQYDLLSRSRCGSRALSNLRLAVSTSALLSKRTAEDFFTRFALRLTQVYGIIEVGLPLWNDIESIDPTALGICKDPYQAIVVDDEGVPVPTGSVGELAIRGPGLFAGYLMGHGTESPRVAQVCLLAGEWFLTGDLVVRDQLGVILYRGRKKSVINCGGNKVFPEEIEELLREDPEIDSVRVIGEANQLLGSSVVAEVVLAPDVKTPVGSSIERWRNRCLSELSEFKVPREFRIVKSLPTTGSGKIVRH